jgi:ATP-dependent Clp protease ATP-binding subunit ClpB
VIPQHAIVLTSNLGSGLWRTLPDRADIERAGRRYGEAIRRRSAGILNRPTRSCCSAACRATHEGIVEIQLRHLQKLLADRKIALEIDAQQDRLADRG